MAKLIIWLCNKFPWATNLQDDIMSYYLLKSIFNSFCRYFRWHFSRIGAKEMTSCHSFKAPHFKLFVKSHLLLRRLRPLETIFLVIYVGILLRGVVIRKISAERKNFEKIKVDDVFRPLTMRNFCLLSCWSWVLQRRNFCLSSKLTRIGKQTTTGESLMNVPLLVGLPSQLLLGHRTLTRGEGSLYDGSTV